MAGAEIGALIAKVLVPLLAAAGIAWALVAYSKRRDRGVVAQDDLDELERMADLRDRAERKLDEPAPTGPEIPASWRKRARRRLEREGKL